MKIGILTFHRAYNYGAFLQCYSLLGHLKQDFPEAHVEVIDYESYNMYNYYKTDIFSLMFGHSSRHQKLSLKQRLSKTKQFCKKIFRDASYINNLKLRNKHFENAILTLDLSAQRLISDDYEKIVDFINLQNYDLIVVGSDAIWNDAQTSKPNVYYLSHKIKAVAVSYAASSFGMDYLQKDKKELIRIGELINKFQYVGVRDNATEDYMKLLDLETQVEHTCDPSIILDLKQKEFNIDRIIEKLQNSGIDLSKPIFGIMGGDWLGKIARNLIGETAQLVALYEPNRYADIYLCDLTPFEWAKVFSLFTITFTHFFHGTLFSLKNKTPTISIEWENDYSKKFDTKILDVLKRLKLEDYRFTKKDVETDSKNLQEHFGKVVNDLEYEKERITRGLEYEAKTYDNFLFNLKEKMRDE